MTFIDIYKKYITLRNDLTEDRELPLNLQIDFDLMTKTYNQNPSLYADNHNVVKFMLNVDSILSFADCTNEDFSSHYTYYFLGSKTKILLKNNITIYCIDSILDIYAKISC